ncbi:HAD-IA family hydrolase [Pontivivens ytuae]|uniref:phosphoglycolate phosphatase n=1 Tax=Pontivivens ytuae TaxID=2789856 RepID=A0A7S9LSN8_9RHOB|nr:HAD-IA family hydrolase [Pontivivens ytuae]QPH54379.1 HAD-IA family hydrolase [Pontivivens ytuae]
MRLVIDLDETLVNSVPTLAAAANVVLGELGRAPMSAEDYVAHVGWGMRAQIKGVLEATGGVPGGDVGPYLRRMIEVYAADPLGETRPYPGARAALELLVERGHALAVCTQKPEAQAREILERLDLVPPITGLTGAGTLDVLKPDPAMLHHAAGQLPGEAPVVMIGDSTVDAQTAQNAGVPFLLFAPAGRAKSADVPAQGRFAAWSELPDLVARLEAQAA